MKQATFLIDSNVAIQCLRPSTKRTFINFLKTFITEDALLALSHITLFEVLAGSQKNELKNTTLFLNRFPILALTNESVTEAAGWYRSYRIHGKTLSIGDLLIAGIVKYHRTKLLTMNGKHFPMMKHKESYRVGASVVHLMSPN